MIPIQLILEIFAQTETELTVEIEEILTRIKDRNLKIADLLEQNEKINQEIRNAANESEILLNQYYQLISALKLQQYAFTAEESTGVYNGNDQNTGCR